MSNKNDLSDDLELSLVSTLGESDLSGIVTDIGEASLDAIMMDDGILKDIPVLGVFAKTYSILESVSNRLFAKKVLQFLTQLADVPKHQRREQISKLVVDRQHQKRVGENLLLILDRMNDMEKPILLSLAFRAFLEEQIDFVTFQNLASALDFLQMTAIEKLKNIYDDEVWYNRIGIMAESLLDPDPELQHLALCGLMTIAWDNIGNIGGFEGKPLGGFKRNELGKQFCDILIFRKKNPPQ